jgi:tellurite resistance protein TerA
MCAIALIENIDGSGLKVKRLVEYFSGHREMDKAYRWGLRWVAGSK